MADFMKLCVVNYQSMSLVPAPVIMGLNCAYYTKLNDTLQLIQSLMATLIHQVAKNVESNDLSHKVSLCYKGKGKI